MFTEALFYASRSKKELFHFKILLVLDKKIHYNAVSFNLNKGHQSWLIYTEQL